MAYRRKKQKQHMGRVITCVGLILKIIQLIGAAFSADALTGSVPTLVTTCLLVGGFAVISVERLSISSVFSALSAIFVLAGILATTKPEYTFYFMAASFVLFGATLISLKSRNPILCGSAVIILTAVLFMDTVLGLYSIPAPLITVILVSVYALTGVGLYI